MVMCLGPAVLATILKSGYDFETSLHRPSTVLLRTQQGKDGTVRILALGMRQQGLCQIARKVESRLNVIVVSQTWKSVSNDELIETSTPGHHVGKTSLPWDLRLSR
jgi:hypothetical protein